MGDRFEITAGAEALLRRFGLDSLGGLFAWSQGDRLDKPGLAGWRQRWRLRIGRPGVQGEPTTLYLKRFDRPPWREQWARWREGQWGTSTAGVEWRNAAALAAAGVRAVRAAAYGELVSMGWERRSAILLHEVRGESLERWIPAHLPPAELEPDWPRRRRLLDEVASLVARFHAAGFVHRDLYLAHVFIMDGSAGRGRGLVGGSWFEPTLIDLQRVFRPRWRRRRWVVKDLAALHYSTPADRVGRLERLRFLCRYVRACPRWGSARALAARVEAKTA